MPVGAVAPLKKSIYSTSMATVTRILLRRLPVLYCIGWRDEQRAMTLVTVRRGEGVSHAPCDVSSDGARNLCQYEDVKVLI